MPIILNDKFKYNSATQIGLKSSSVTSIIGNTAGVTIIGGTATTADLSFQTTSGVGTTGADMHFLVGNAGATEAMTILNNGNVGIGTTGPGAKLSFATGTTAADGIDFGGDTNLYRLSANILQSDDQFRAGNLYTEGTFYTNTWTGTSTDHDITAKIRDNKKFYINNNENGTIVTVDESNGNVGIGTTGPSQMLHLESSTASKPILHLKNTNADANSAGITFRKDSASPADNDYLGYIAFYGNDSGGNNHQMAIIQVTEDDVTNGTEDATMSFGTIVAGAGGGPTTNMVIKDGNVGIGDATPTYKLDVNGTGRFTGALTLDSTLSAGGIINTNNNWISGDGGAEGISIDNNGNVGIGTTAPTNLLSLGGESARIFWMERELTADTAGNTLTITAGGATSGATDKAGGALILQGGLSTGSAESGVTIQGCVAGAAGTADRTQTTAIQVLGNKLGFWAATPVVQSTGWAISNKTADKVLDCNVTTIDELADLVGTIVDTLKDYGLFAA